MACIRRSIYPQRFAMGFSKISTGALDRKHGGIIFLGKYRRSVYAVKSTGSLACSEESVFYDLMREGKYSVLHSLNNG